MYLLRFLTLPLFSACALPFERLVNGEDAKRNEHPYIVSLQMTIPSVGITIHNCGGIIISPTWVLTAGSCKADLGAIEFTLKVVAGILDVNEDPSSERDVVDFIVHPNYEGGVAPYDIALLKLSEPLIFSESVQPIALPEPGVVPKDEALVAGWGSSTKTILQHAVVSILTQSECADALIGVLGSAELLHETNVCTAPGVATCTGDSGSPLVQEGVVVGVVSWGIVPCGYPGAPSVYTRVSSFVDFILQFVDDLPAIES